MRILVVGAGSVGGYFGGRLLEAGQDVTFLVCASSRRTCRNRPRNSEPFPGDVSVSNPATIVAENLHERSDLVLLACKAYDLEGAISSFAPAVGPDTAILPLLNGMRHLDILDRRFGAGHVLGGQCLISKFLNERGEIVHSMRRTTCPSASGTVLAPHASRQLRLCCRAVTFKVD